MSKYKKNKQERFKKLQVDEFNSRLYAHVTSVLEKIKYNSSVVEAELTRFTSKQHNRKKIFHHYTELWLKWLDYDIQKYEEGAFAGIESIRSDFDSMWKALTTNEFWKNINFYETCSDMKWGLRFTKKAKNKVIMFSWQIREELLRKLIELSIGHIVPKRNCEIIEEGPCANMIFFSSTIKGTSSLLLFAILVDRLPIIRYNKLVQYKFVHYLKVIDIVKQSKNLGNSIEAFKNSIKADPDRWVEPKLDDDGNFVFAGFTNSVQSDHTGYVYPVTFSRVYLTSRETNAIIFDESKNRWISTEILNKPISLDLDPYQISLINSLGNSTSCLEFINFLKRIPDFKIKLTEEQEFLISSPGNVLAIGRSGTGKTTCSLLRLLSTEILFRFTKLRDRSKRFSPEDLDRSTMLHTVFVTASPVLTNEVMRYYNKLNDHIKQKLKDRDERLKKNEEVEVIDLTSDEEIAEEEESESEDKAEGPASMEFLRDEDFPLFVTVRKVVFMIDAAMKRPFFARNKEGNVIGSTSKFQWHNEFKGALMINKQFKAQRQTEDIGNLKQDSSDSDEEYEDDEPNTNPTRRSKQSQRIFKKSFRHLSYEVDFSIFCTKFYPRIAGRCKYLPLLLWTEISAYIKGSGYSFKSPGSYLSRHAYIYMGRKTSMLNESEKYEIWDFFIEYERWKVREDAYDMQDVVNYLLNQISFYGYTGVPIHYMMVDEVQDLTPAMLNLLLLVTKQKLFFSGDTAQTIAKGVGFRFCDLKSLFHESRLEAPKVCQLSMNFRTHNQILGLANSVIALLETLFPLTIDKMGKEISPRNGPRPVVMTSTSIEDLLYLVFGGMSLESESKPLEFGCNQVIIVRSQESKEKLPSILRHALCLTVFEAKGLEFDDVILFNFFTDTEAEQNVWRVLRNIQKKQGVMEDSAFSMQRLEDLEEALPKLIAEIQPNDPNYSMLCTELKHFYVAVTRPKKRLLLFDEDLTCRNSIEKYWELMEVVDFVSVDAKVEGLSSGGFAQKTSKPEWKQQGLRMFSHKYYEQAQKCFEIAEESALAARAKGYTLANKAGDILISIESSVAQLEYEKKPLTKAIKKDFSLKKALSSTLFIEAAECFILVAAEIPDSDKPKILKEAARCFASGNQHIKAAEIFKDLGLFGQAAESKMANQQYEEAGDLFYTKQECQRAIEAYKLGGCWDKLIKTIFTFKDQLTLIERQKLLTKYMPVALEDLTPKLIPMKDQDTSYLPSIAQEIQSTIKEADNESSSDSEYNETPIEIPKPSTQVFNDEVVNKDESFVLLSKESSFAVLSGLEDIDPTDEWLQLETGSVVESLESIIQPDGSILSDFSILPSESTTLHRLIKTRGDIFIEDDVMRKIIEYVSMFSEEFTTYLKSLRSSSSLLTSLMLKQDWELVSLIDLEELSTEMLGLLLDTLEEYGMYRLCLIVCNRYNLVERAGRFIVSLAFKYSNISMITFAGFRINSREQVQRAAIAFTALHNVLEMINPCYLKADDPGNALSFDTFRALILLGYWKKVVYLVGKTEALALVWNFADFNAFDEICEREALGRTVEVMVMGMDRRTLASRGIKAEVGVVRKDEFRGFKYTETVISAISSGVDVRSELLEGSRVINEYFTQKISLNDEESMRIYDVVNAFSLLMQNFNSSIIRPMLLSLEGNEIESLFHSFSYIIRYLKTSSTRNKPLQHLRHCILSSIGVRSIQPSSVTNMYPIYSHSFILQSSPLLKTLPQECIYAADLECQCFLAPNSNINKAFISLISSCISRVIKARLENSNEINSELNLFGDSWLLDFITSERPYSISSYNYSNPSNSEAHALYLSTKSKLDKLKGEEQSSDIYFTVFMLEKNAKAIKDLKNKLKEIEGSLYATEAREATEFIDKMINRTKYIGDEMFKVTSTTRHALLTYAQVLVDSSEAEIPEKRIEKLWMAYELCRVSGNMSFFIEMLRCRNRPIEINGKKVCKLAAVYEDAVGFADVSAYHKCGCFYQASVAIVQVLQSREIQDGLKLYLLQKATVYWGYSYCENIDLVGCLKKFERIKRDGICRGSGGEYDLLELACMILIEFSVKAITDNLRQKFLSEICDCISMILQNVNIDSRIEEIVKNFKKKPSLNTCKSLLPYHRLFIYLNDFPLLKLDTQESLKISHKMHSTTLHDNEWLKECQQIAQHQTLSAKIKRFRMKAIKQPYLTQSQREYLNKNPSTYNQLKLFSVNYEYLSQLFNCLYRIVLFKSLDMHYLLDQIFLVYENIQAIGIGNTEEKIEEIKDALISLENWKNIVKPTGDEINARRKKKWNVGWRNRTKNIKIRR